MYKIERIYEAVVPELKECIRRSLDPIPEGFNESILDNMVESVMEHYRIIIEKIMREIIDNGETEIKPGDLKAGDVDVSGTISKGSIREG